MNTILDQLQPIFRQVLDQKDLVITRNSSAKNVDYWDSLSHINLVSAIERYFKIRFGLGELQELKNVGEMVDLIESKLKSK
jgi:acyl carrier protein